MPTIIESLIVKLGLETKDLDTKGATAGKRLDGIEKSGKAASRSVQDLTRSIGAFLAALGGTYALKAFIEDTIASSAALDRLSKNLGVSVENISAWSNAVEELGGNAKGLQGTMSMLSQQQTELRLTGQSSLVPYFAALGVAMSNAAGAARPVDDILLDLADKFSHLDRPTANNLGHMMGIDQDTLNLLLQGRREVELTIKRQKEYNAVSKAQAEESAKLQKAIVGLRQGWVALGRDLLQQASPAIERMLGVLSQLAGWVQNNKEFIGDLAKILGLVAAGLTAVSIASSPITLTVAAVIALAAAIALLWQDYQTWKRGGDSLIDWAKWKPGIDAAIAGVKELAKVVKESFGAIYDDVGAVKKLINGDWRGALADARKSDDRVRNALGSAAHGALGLGKGAIASERSPGNVTDAYAMKYFQDRGISPNEAAALASQIHSESNGRVNAVGDNGSAYGLIQWHADRQANFKKQYGHDIHQSSADEQLAFIIHELMSTERGAGNRIKGAGSAEQAGELASKYYVRPKDTLGEAMRRGAYAQMLAGAGSGGGNTAHTDRSVSVQTGPVTINTQATDADGISKDFVKSFGYAFTAQANTGLN